LEARIAELEKDRESNRKSKEMTSEYPGIDKYENSF